MPVDVMVMTDGEVYRTYADELLRFATALVGPSGAEDVLGDALLKAFASRSWTGVQNHRAYLYRAVLNQARSVHRSTQRRLAREAATASEHRYEPTTVRAEVLDALRRLTVRQRAVVFLTYWVDLQPEAIAEQLQITARTVQRDLRSAHGRLEVLLG
jgi:RNA polymerase sigma-70 factor (ECF subfamily)